MKTIVKEIKAIFPDDNPLSPKIIELKALIEITDNGLRFIEWIFPSGSNFDDVQFFLEFVSDPKCKMQILGFE